MRAALVQAIHHATYRRAFGAPLIDHPLMQNVLADLALESEGGTALSSDSRTRRRHTVQRPRRGATTDRHGNRQIPRLKRAPAVVGEAFECLGGNGYVEESIMPRLYREAPLNSIWEGTGKSTHSTPARFTEATRGVGGAPRRTPPALHDPRIAARRANRSTISPPKMSSGERARSSSAWRFCGKRLTLEHAPNAVSDAFQSRPLHVRSRSARSARFRQHSYAGSLIARRPTCSWRLDRSRAPAASRP